MWQQTATLGLLHRWRNLRQLRPPGRRASSEPHQPARRRPKLPLAPHRGAARPALLPGRSVRCPEAVGPAVPPGPPEGEGPEWSPPAAAPPLQEPRAPSPGLRAPRQEVGRAAPLERTVLHTQLEMLAWLSPLVLYPVLLVCCTGVA